MENYWVEKEIDLGMIKENTTTILQYNSLVNIPKISDIRPGCGCTSASFDEDTGVLSAKYNSGDIPYHLENKNQEFNKVIRVEYIDGTQDYLKFRGTKVKNND